MLKIIENKEEALDLVEHLARQDFLEDFRVGATGSFMSDSMKKSSALDIILKLNKDGDTDMIGSISLLRQIRSYLGEFYHTKVNVLWYDLLVSDDESLLVFANAENLEPNPESVYMNIVEAIQWVSISEDEDTDEDTDEEGDEIDG